MRYQERIYIQNEYSGVRNRDISIFNMSSDICIFQNPEFSLTGTSKIDCTGSTTGNTYIMSADTETIPLNFNFTGNTSSFSANSATFRYEIYKYSAIFSGFPSTPVYKSQTYSYSGFSGTNIVSDSVSVSNLGLDGDYLIKGYYNFPVCTDYLSRLNKNVSTYNYMNGDEYGIYNKDTDYYFIAFMEAEVPTFTNVSSGNIPSASLFQSTLPMNVYVTTGSEAVQDDPNSVFTADTRIVALPSFYTGVPIITFNGLVLAEGLDYTLSGTVVTLKEYMTENDVVTAIYTTTDAATTLTTDVIVVDTNVTSGVTNNQGANLVYYNTTTNKYEIYSSISPVDFSSVVVMINGVSLASNIDFYQSISNKRRIILVGDVVIGDIITIAYFPSAGVASNVYTSDPVVGWSIKNPPKLTNGYFTLELANDISFNSIIYTGRTDYIVDTYFYGLPLSLSGDVNTKYYYRVRNDKNYTTICGNQINSYVYSETIPITIATNSINSY
jgi:hypothetical protein